MRHRRKKGRFKPVCRFGGVLGIAQCRLGLLEGRDIHNDADQPAGRTVRRAESADRIQGLVLAPVGKRNDRLAVQGAPVGDHVRVLRLVDLAIRHRQIVQIEHGLSDDRIPADRERFLVCAVAAPKPRVRILIEDRAGDVVHQGVQKTRGLDNFARARLHALPQLNRVVLQFFM